MQCPDCGGHLRVYRTYHISTTSTRHYCRCEGCGSKHKTLTHYEGRLEARNPTDALAMLVEWGVSRDKAKLLTKTHPAQVIKEYCREFPTLKAAYEQKTGKTVGSESGFLVWAIDTRYPLSTNGHNGKGESLSVTEQPTDLQPATLPPATLQPAEPDVWQTVLGQLQLQMTRATFENWIKDTWLVSCDGGQWVVAVKSEFAKDWLENRLAKTILQASRQQGAREVKFIVKEQA
jgi:hypothetical protein